MAEFVIQIWQPNITTEPNSSNVFSKTLKRLNETSTRLQQHLTRLERDRSDLLEAYGLDEEPDWILSPSGECVDLSARCCELLQVPRQELLIHGWRKAVHEDDFPLEDYIQHVRRALPWSAEYRINAGGQWRKVRGVVVPIFDGRRHLASAGRLIDL